MKDRETPRMHKYGESKTTEIMMATVRHVTSRSGLRKFQADGFFFRLSVPVIGCVSIHGCRTQKCEGLTGRKCTRLYVVILPCSHCTLYTWIVTHHSSAFHFTKQKHFTALQNVPARLFAVDLRDSNQGILFLKSTAIAR